MRKAFSATDLLSTPSHNPYFQEHFGQKKSISLERREQSLVTQHLCSLPPIHPSNSTGQFEYIYQCPALHLVPQPSLHLTTKHMDYPQSYFSPNITNLFLCLQPHSKHLTSGSTALPCTSPYFTNIHFPLLHLEVLNTPSNSFLRTHSLPALPVDPSSRPQGSHCLRIQSKIASKFPTPFLPVHRSCLLHQYSWTLL